MSVEVIVTLCLVAAGALLNFALRHQDELSPGWRRTLRVALDLLSVVWQRGTAPKGVPLLRNLKLPGQKSPSPTVVWFDNEADKEGGWSDFDVLIVYMTLMGAILFGVNSCLQGCASWQDTTTRTLQVATEVNRTAPRLMHEACDAVMQSCIADRLNPCDTLDRCHDAETEVVKAAVAAQSAVLVGFAAVELGDAKQAADVLTGLLLSLKPICQAGSVYEVKPIIAACRGLGVLP